MHKQITVIYVIFMHNFSEKLLTLTVIYVIIITVKNKRTKQNQKRSECPLQNEPYPI